MTAKDAAKAILAQYERNLWLKIKVIVLVCSIMAGSLVLSVVDWQQKSTEELFGSDGATKAKDAVTYTQLDPLESQLHNGFQHYNMTIQTNVSQAEVRAWLGDREAQVIMNADLVGDGMLFWASENVTPVYWEE